MSRSASEEKAFTLVEVAVALAVAGLLALVVVRFYKDSYKTFSLQEQLAERNQNANYVVTRLAEILQQAGAGLPDTGWSVVRISDGTLIIGVNPRGAESFISVALPMSRFVPIGDATLFKNNDNVLLNTTHILIQDATPGAPIRRVPIDLSYNDQGFVNGVKDNPAGLDSLRLSWSVYLTLSDRIFGYREDRYLLSGGNLVLRPNGNTDMQMVLAEHIDSLGFTFQDARGNPTTDWRAMRSASFAVRARTSRPDPKLPPPGYRKITIPMNVFLRGRI